ESVERAGVLAAELEMHNAERRALEDAMVAEAVSAIEARRDPHARTIVVAREGWHPGVVGIVAARLAERFHRPALAIALEGATARGSGRSVRGVHLHAALGECRALLEAFGGHRQAVGLPVRVGDRVDIVFRPRLARWQGTERLEAEVLDLCGGAPAAAQATENAREIGVP